MRIFLFEKIQNVTFPHAHFKCLYLKVKPRTILKSCTFQWNAVKPSSGSKGLGETKYQMSRALFDIQLVSTEQ